MQISSLFQSNTSLSSLFKKDATERFAGISLADIAGPPEGITPDNDPSQVYAHVKVNGEIVATLYNSGSVESSNAIGGRINALVKDDTAVGPELAADRAERIAKMLGGTVERADTAQSQSAWESWSDTRNQALAAYYNTTPTHLAAQETAAGGAELQESAAVGVPSAADEFKEFMKMSPAERMVDQILKSLGVTPEDLENMTPEEFAATMEKVRQIIEEQMRQASGIAGSSSAPITDQA